jgi:hypothetical protein
MESTSMKVIYKPYMMRRINEEIRKACESDREIEKIKLTSTEWNQLKDECCKNMGPMEWLQNFVETYGLASDGSKYRTTPTYATVLGVRVEVE